MTKEGYGGRIGFSTDDFRALNGLIAVEERELLPVAECANPKCGRPFRPRAEGDDYCNERCDPLNKFKGVDVGSAD